jgi:hypothetical protein
MQRFDSKGGFFYPVGGRVSPRSQAGSSSGHDDSCPDEIARQVGSLIFALSLPDAFGETMSLEEELMRRIVLAALIACFAVGTAAAQSCDSRAVGANGKPLHGAAKMSFVRKCKRDTCAGKAVSAEGKPLHGAAKNSFMRKCERTA